MTDIDEIRRRMDEKFADGNAYPVTTLWDRERTSELHAAVLELALRPSDGFGAPRDPGLTLDAGCGAGAIADYWPEQSTLVGVELSPVAVERIRQEKPRIEVHASAIEDYQDERRFETVVCSESIEHWPDAGAGLDAIRRLMAPHGVLVLTTPNRDSLHARIGRKLNRPVPFCCNDHVTEFGYGELLELLAVHGFEVTRSVGVFLQPYWALEAVFGTAIRKLTDDDPDVVSWLRRAGRAVPELAFCQCHACVLQGD